MTIRWGIIGCGKVTEVKSGPDFQKATDSALVMVMRRDADKAEDYVRRHGVPRWTTDADALIHDPEVDAVYIATPPGAHLEYALCVAAAGKPAYVEKPMARHHAECRRMIEAFARAGQPPNPLHIQQPLIQSIVDQLHGRSQCPSTGTTAARTTWVMDQVLADYYGGRDDAFWTRPATWPGRRG